MGLRDGLGEVCIEGGDKKLRSLEFVMGVWERIVEARGVFSKNFPPKNITNPIKTERIITNISVFKFIVFLSDFARCFRSRQSNRLWRIDILDAQIEIVCAAKTSSLRQILFH